MVCRRCQVKYIAAASEANNPPEMLVEHVRGRIRRTAELLTATGLFGILCSLVFLGVFGVQTALAFEDYRRQIDDVLMFGLVTGNLLLSGVVMYGGARMMRVRNYPLCVTAAIIAMLPFANICFPTGWIYGPLALYWLRKPMVRKAFALNSPDFDPDS